MSTHLDYDVATCDALLADGCLIHIRPIAPEDAERLVDFHSALSDETVYLRFFSAHGPLRPDEVFRFTNVDGHDRMALVATVRDGIIGVARYDRSDPSSDEAEVAFVVADAYQGRGVGTLLLETLAAYARTQDVSRFRAETLAHNEAMKSVFRHAGFAVESSFDLDVVDVRMDIQPTDAFMHAVDARWEESEAESIRRLLRPRSVAVVGAGTRRGGIGREILRNILTGGFPGDVYPVHPSASAIEGRRAFKSVADIPGDIDLAVLAVPPESVTRVVEECSAKSVSDLVIITAGYAEAGEVGSRAQADLVARARSGGMRIVGPNCMGIINTAPSVSLNATFAPVRPQPGRVAFASQSGGLGIAVLEEATRRGIGVSSFVSMGNKADISGNDLLQYWHHDDDTDVILLYLESFGNPRRFARIARRVSADKPIIAVKAGRSGSGRRAASSHTAALASPDAAVDALFGQAGVIRVDTLEEMFDATQVLADQPVPAGRRVAIVGNAGGPGILAADACEANGLVVPELSREVQDSLRSFLPSAASVSNPVDMVASASAADYERALELVLRDPGVDAVLAVFVPPLITSPDDVAAAISTVVSRSDKPVVANFLGMASPPSSLRSGPERVPSFCFPEPAARALARACEYGEWRSRGAGHPVLFDDLDPASARALIASVLSTAPEGRWLRPEEATSILGCYGIRMAPFATATGAGEARAAADRIGYPVALKAFGTSLIHKSDEGGVALSLDSADAVDRAFSDMKGRLASRMEGAVVQAMAPDGVETIVGVVDDPSFGPLVMFGSGGTAVELFADRAFRILPMTDMDADDLVRSLRGAPLLLGYRGSPPVDLVALEGVLLRVARLAEDVPEMAEMDLNPLICGPWGAIAVDVRIRIAPPRARPDETVRRLR